MDEITEGKRERTGKKKILFSVCGDAGKIGECDGRRRWRWLRWSGGKERKEA